MNVFERVSAENGLNQLPSNPCNLLNFELLVLGGGQTHTLETGNREVVAVILGGVATFDCGSQTFEAIGSRATVFDGKPTSVYLPCDSMVTILGIGKVEIALCSAPSDLAGEPYVIAPADVVSGTWGRLNFTRHFNQILTESSHPQLPARRIIIGETFTPSGNWSTYPAHKHEVDNLPDEAFHEEMYYFRVTPNDGFGITRFYHNDDDAINFTVRDNTILMLPDGYHTYVGAPGFNSYYLWFLAGEHRQQAVIQDVIQEREVNKL